MNTKFCNVHIPDMDKVLDVLERCKNQHQMSNLGPAHEKFRNDLHGFLSLSDSKDIMPVCSGHIALMTALSTLRSQKVLVPAYTFSSTLQAASLQGIEATVIDVGSRPYLTVEELEKTESSGVEFDTVLFVAPVSIFPEEIYDIQRWCRLRSINLIIDGAATFGTPDVYNLGDAYCLSFHATKSFPVGEGGAVILNKDKMISARSYICFGMDRARRVIKPGLNGKISEYSAAIGVALLEEILPYLKTRRENTDLLKELLNATGCYIPDSITGTVYQSFPLYTEKADKALKYLREKGFEANQYYVPLENMENASNFYKNNICLPCHPDVSQEEIEQMADIIKSV